MSMFEQRNKFQSALDLLWIGSFICHC